MLAPSVERRIAIGLIVSTQYMRRIKPFWSYDFIVSPEIRRIAMWCWSYFDKYDQAPDRDIEGLFARDRERGRVDEDELELIEIILSRASVEYGRGDNFSVAYLYDQTVEYFRKRELELHTARVQQLLESDRLKEAQELQASFVPSSFELTGGVEVGNELSLRMVEEGFSTEGQSVLRYPGALGELMNEHLVRSGFVAFLAPEKRGKTFFLIDMAVRALRFGRSHVAFFAAGDMTEKQILKRIAVYLTKRNDRERYCEEHWRPVVDCMRNQCDSCSRPERACDFGFREGASVDDVMAHLKKAEVFDVLVQHVRKNPRYRPCNARACPDFLGTVWLERVAAKEPLTAEAAKLALQKFKRETGRSLRIKSYDTGTLTVAEVRRQLDEWEQQDQFVPDVIIIDYADIMDAPNREYRHKQNEIWMGLRGLSIQRDCLVVTATQADADSYRRDRLDLTNFSEDKRKYSHVTAMWALNQDASGREKKLGMIRVSPLLVREGEADLSVDVVVLQDLWCGRPFTASFLRRV